MLASTFSPQLVRTAWRLALASTFATMLAQPVLAQAEPGLLSRIFSGMAGNRMTVERNVPGHWYRLKVNGSMRVTAAEDDVSAISGSMSLREKRNGVERVLIIKSDGAGGMSRKYSVNGKAQEFDADAKRWFAELLPVLLRETGVESAQRIERLMARGGVPAVLAEIELIQSDHARRIYIDVLARRGQLEDKPLLQLLDSTAAMGSDYERRLGLTTIVEVQALKPVHLVKVLNSVAAIGSSYEQRQVLTALAPKLPTDAVVLQAWQSALAKVDSDFERTEIIKHMVRRANLPPAHLDVALQSTFTVQSSHEHAAALTALVKVMDKATPAQIAAYAQSAQRIESDFERRAALMALVRTGTLDKAGFAIVLGAVEGMQSSHEITTLLQAVARAMPPDATLVAAYRRLARALPDHERGQAEKALDRLGL